MAASNAKLAQIAQRLEAVEAKRTGKAAPAPSGSNDLEALVSRIERVSLSLAESGSLARLAKVEANLVAGNGSATAGSDLSTMASQVESVVDSVATALGKPAPKATPAAPAAAPAAKAASAPTPAPAPVKASPTPAVTPSKTPEPIKSPEPKRATTAVVGDKVVPVSSAPAITSDGLRSNPKLDELRQQIELLNKNDPNLKELNLNNNEVCRPEHGIAIAEALMKNTNLKSLQMVNCKLSTPTAEAFAKMLRVNKTLENLNLESNEFTGPGIKAIAEALPENTTLLELKLTNQRSLTGTEAERALAVAFETNQTIVKFVLPIKDPGSRNSIDRAMSRNAEIARKKKMATKK